MTRRLELLDAVFSAALRGENAIWPPGFTEDETETARRRLLYHGIAGLLHERRELLEGWPRPLLDTLHEESFARAMWEMRHKVLLGEVVEALSRAGVPSALLKGTAFAYALYPNPALRFRGDSDLLIAPGDLKCARDILAALGWRRPGHGEGPFGNLHFQEVWQVSDPVGLTHDIDLHWEVTNTRALREVLDGAQVLSHAIPLTALSPHARCAEPVTALIHRAINRAEHARSGYFSLDRNEYDADRLLWAMDIDLLVMDLTPDDWQVLTRHCINSGIASIVSDALEFARRSLRTAIPEDVSKTLATTSQDTAATRFMTTPNEFVRAWADIRAAPGLISGLRYILARMFPSSAHIRSKYPSMKRWPLLVLYLRRQGAALARLLTKICS